MEPIQESLLSPRTRKQSDQTLLEILSKDPRYAHLVEAPDQVELSWRETMHQGLKKFLKPDNIIHIFLADPKGLHGTAYVTPAVKKDSVVLANTISASNLTDFLTNWPLLFYAFNGLGLGFGLLLSGALNVGILKFGNEVATATARNRPQNRAFSKYALICLLALNIVQSLASGPGVELLNNGTALSEKKASDLIEAKKEQVEQLAEVKTPQYDVVKASCDNEAQELNSMNRDHPRWDSIYVRLYGSYAQQDNDWRQVPLELLPICRQVTRLEQEAYKAYETAKASLETQLIERSKLGSDVLFIKQFYPDLYVRTFTETGELKSGVEAVGYATSSFFGNLSKGRIGRISFSLFFFSLSVITSAAACLMTISFSQREDVQRSWNDQVRRERDRLIYQQVYDLLEQKRRHSEEQQN